LQHVQQLCLHHSLLAAGLTLSGTTRITQILQLASMLLVYISIQPYLSLRIMALVACLPVVWPKLLIMAVSAATAISVQLSRPPLLRQNRKLCQRARLCVRECIECVVNTVASYMKGPVITCWGWMVPCTFVV
jgi:hypothetical protein